MGVQQKLIFKGLICENLLAYISNSHIDWITDLFIYIYLFIS